MFQFKYHADKTLKEGISAIEEVAEARGLYDADIAIAVTNTSFSPKARSKAKEKNVILWDGEYSLSQHIIFPVSFYFKIH